MYREIQPEVIVDLGERTEFLEQEQPFSTVTNLHIELEDWLGDDLMECALCRIVTERLKTALEKSTFSGFSFAEMEVTKGEYFSDNYDGEIEVPKFHWMKITGKENKDDLFLAERGTKLFCSQRLLDFITSNFSTKYLDIDPKRDEFDDFLDQMISEME